MAYDLDDIVNQFHPDDFGKEASYQRAAGGDPVDVWVIFNQPAGRIANLQLTKRIALMPVAHLPDAKGGDSITIEGTTYRIGIVTHVDADQLIWQLELQP
ncbi:MAG TPA: hypothetical protein DFI00_06185 [Rhodospirillaceae bacterium]|nr:hypothetical protein [Alphaproteobacteria bacterium]OUT41962.1 MAG: hypothetical protein CBB62_06545 [Micavibrio sp. TMED2]HCI46863.1 hypothetical protein [Rhodospirillaceae bacterium]MAS46442.1 hypothetical protein [Alphaproteobacteria bacterium]MAX94537.1 hypothetical protein [Alphaproteobacteria bacterium]|tara:strand:- start:9874 stop:10173 length:300 start_codon:yes stop_codon:yes gene_type:complete